MSGRSNFVVSVHRKTWIPDARRLYIAEPYVYHVLERDGALSRYESVQVAPFVRTTPAELAHDSAIVDARYERYLPMLAERLNRIHGTSYPERFWRKALSLDLLRYITLCYEMFDTCERRFDPASHDCRVIETTGYHIPADFNEQREFLQSTAYGQEQLFSTYVQVFHSGRFQPITDRFAWPAEASNPVSHGRALLTRLRNANWQKVRSKLVGLAARVRHPTMVVVNSYFSHKNLADLVSGSRGRIQWLELPSSFNFGSPDAAKRAMLAERDASFDRFDQFFFESMRSCMPRMFVEGFANVTAQYTRELDKLPSLLYVVNESWIGESRMAIAMAMLNERGVKHVYNEHSYFSHHFLRNHFHHLFPLVDRFVTLGWHDERYPTLVRGGSLRAWTYPKAKEKEHDILFVTGQPPVKRPEFSAAYGNLGGFNAESHLRFNHRFFGALSRQTRSRIVFRGYPTHHYRVARLDPPMFAYDQEYALRDFMADFNAIDNVSPSGQALMLKSRLVVIDYLSTSYIESIVADIPTVFFWNRENYPLEEAYGGFYDVLVQAGICQTDPERAAAFIESIANDPQEWWNRRVSRDARQTFLNANFGDPSVLKNYLLSLT